MMETTFLVISIATIILGIESIWKAFSENWGWEMVILGVVLVVFGIEVLFWLLLNFIFWR